MTVKTSRKGSARVTPVSDTAYEIERTFDAKAESVFRAMTEPQYIRRWWGFPDVHEPLMLLTTKFTERNGVTTQHSHVECYTPEVLNGVLESGMESGLQVSYDRIEDLLVEIEG